MAIISNSTFSEGGTLGVTGGTTKTLVSKGGNAFKHDFYVDEDTSSSTRRTLTSQATPARADKTKPNGMTQERYVLTLRQPKQLSNEAWTVNVAGFSLAVDPETTDAERTALANQLLQIANNAADLILKGNVS